MKRIGTTTLILFAALHLHARDVILVTANDTNECLFASGCAMPEGVTTTNQFELEGNEGTGELVVRTFPADEGTAAAGRHVYLFRVDLRNMTGTNCIVRLTIPFGPVVTDFDYDANGVAGDDVFVNSRLGIDPGNFGPPSATLEGNLLSFEFDEMCPGEHSYFLGVISDAAPVASGIEIFAVSGGAVVEGQSPLIGPGLVFTQLRTFLTQLSLDSINARKERARQKRLANLLKLATKAENKAERKPRAALALLRNIGKRTDGLKRDWVIDDPITPGNEPAELFSLVQQASDAIGR